MIIGLLHKLSKDILNARSVGIQMLILLQFKCCLLLIKSNVQPVSYSVLLYILMQQFKKINVYHYHKEDFFRHAQFCLSIPAFLFPLG